MRQQAGRTDCDSSAEHVDGLSQRCQNLKLSMTARDDKIDLFFANSGQELGLEGLPLSQRRRHNVSICEMSAEIVGNAVQDDYP
ncbi:MAG: hypothetical protein KDI66_06830 [Xanthomonadales bacterium]|nr:hypothetical protein [Xanthomonadales bacterium]